MQDNYQKVLSENVLYIRRQIAEAALRAGRRPDEVLLCAACKARTSQEVRISAELQIDLFGENRQQELQTHLDDQAFAGKPCHFIGSLQTNKVKRVVGQVAMIESVNSPRLLEAIHKAAVSQNIVQDILLEINIGEEDSKTGASVDDIWHLTDQALGLSGIRLRGLMAIPPAFDNSDESRKHFAAMKRIFNQMQARYPHHKAIDTLSMGMSDSFIAAILEGANIVRVGTGIYGKRTQ